jgi:hypothetical protein
MPRSRGSYAAGSRRSRLSGFQSVLLLGRPPTGSALITEARQTLDPVFLIQPIRLWCRRNDGKRYPLASLLLIAVAALLSGRRDQLGIVRWGRRLTREALEAIGISRNRVPAPSVWCESFQGLDIAAPEGFSATGYAAISWLDMWR